MVKLTAPLGRPVWVNPAHILLVREDLTHAKETEIVLPGATQRVVESVEEVLATLSKGG